MLHHRQPQIGRSELRRRRRRRPVDVPFGSSCFDVTNYRKRASIHQEMFPSSTDLQNDSHLHTHKQTHSCLFARSRMFMEISLAQAKAKLFAFFLLMENFFRFPGKMSTWHRHETTRWKLF